MNNKPLLLVILAIQLVPTLVYAGPVDEGRAIFMSRCASCHNVNKTMTGPALAGVDKRHSMEWIVKFIHSSQSLVKSGDQDALSLYNQFNSVAMPDHSDLTEGDIKSIVEFIKAEEKVTDLKGPFVKPSHLQTVYTPLSLKNDYGLIVTYLLAVALLIGILLFAVRLRSFQQNTE
jgi:cytochrome c551/c552